MARFTGHGELSQPDQGLQPFQAPGGQPESIGQSDGDQQFDPAAAIDTTDLVDYRTKPRGLSGRLFNAVAGSFATSPPAEGNDDYYDDEQIFVEQDAGEDPASVVIFVDAPIAGKQPVSNEFLDVPEDYLPEESGDESEEVEFLGEPTWLPDEPAESNELATQLSKFVGTPFPPPTGLPAIDPLIVPSQGPLVAVGEPAKVIERKPRLTGEEKRIAKWRAREAAFVSENGSVSDIDPTVYMNLVQEQAIGVGLDWAGRGQGGPLDRPPFKGVIAECIGTVADSDYSTRIPEILEALGNLEALPHAPYQPNMIAQGRNTTIQSYGDQVVERSVDALFDRRVSAEVATANAAAVLDLDIDKKPFSIIGRMVTPGRPIAEIMDTGMIVDPVSGQERRAPILARTDHIQGVVRAGILDDTEVERRVTAYEREVDTGWLSLNGVSRYLQTGATMMLIQDPRPGKMDNLYLVAVAFDRPSGPHPIEADLPDEDDVLYTIDARQVNPSAAPILQTVMNAANNIVTDRRIRDDSVSVQVSSGQSSKLDHGLLIETISNPAVIGVVNNEQKSQLAKPQAAQYSSTRVIGQVLDVESRS
jgi:hypothetical protein